MWSEKIAKLAISANRAAARRGGKQPPLFRVDFVSSEQPEMGA
jgi:hypothetical protein